MEFVQLVEFSTTRIHEVRLLADASQAQARRTRGDGGPRVGLISADHDDPSRFVIIAQFGSYQEAMENSSRPEVSAFARAMAEVCDVPPTFRNLDVLERFGRQPAD